MAVSAIQNDNNSNKSISYTKSAALGALVGYSLKWALPITPQEKDERFNAQIKNISKMAREDRVKAFEEIKNSNNKSLAKDTFVKLHDENKLNQAKIAKLKEPLRTQVQGLKNSVNATTRNTRRTGIKALVSYTKSIRSTNAFVLAGMGTTLVYAFFHNILARLKETNND